IAWMPQISSAASRCGSGPCALGLSVADGCSVSANPGQKTDTKQGEGRRFGDIIDLDVERHACWPSNSAGSRKGDRADASVTVFRNPIRVRGEQEGDRAIP